LRTLILNRIFDGWFFSTFNFFPFWDYENSWNELHIHHFFSTLMCFNWINIDLFCDAYCLSSLESCIYFIKPKTKEFMNYRGWTSSSTLSCSRECGRMWRNELSHSQVSSHFGSCNPDGLSHYQKTIIKVKTHWIKEFVISLESFWNVDV